jgi:hypothetical protein
MHPEHERILRASTPEQKWRTMTKMYWSARELKATVLRDQHPDWDEDKVQAAVREIFMYARD